MKTWNENKVLKITKQKNLEIAERVINDYRDAVIKQKQILEMS